MSRYGEEGTTIKGLALLPGLIAIPAALISFWWYNESVETRRAKAKARFKKVGLMLRSFTSRVHPEGPSSQDMKQSPLDEPEVPASNDGM